MKKIDTRRSARAGLRSLIVVGAVVGLFTLGFAPSAFADTTIGSAQSTLNCGFSPETIVQAASNGPSYTVPAGGGQITSWNIRGTLYGGTARLLVWRLVSGTTYTLVGQSTDQTFAPASGLNTYPVSPSIPVNAGDVLGLYITETTTGAGDDCGIYTSDAADQMLLNPSAPPAVNSNQFFVPGDVFPAEVNVEATITPVAPVRFVVGNSRTASSNSKITATVGANGVAAGDTVDVSVATGTFAGAVGCGDTKGNSYSVVADKNTASGRLFVCSSKLATGLSTGDVVTATYPSFSGLSVVSVTAISATASTGVTDGVSTSSGSNPAVNSGNITTTHAADLLFGVVAHSSPSTFSPGSGYTVVGEVSAGSGAGQRTVSPMFKAVTSTGVYSATGSLSGSGFWQAALIAYQNP